MLHLYNAIIYRTQYLVIVRQVTVNAMNNKVVAPSKPLTDYTLQELQNSTRIVRQSFNKPSPVGKRQASTDLRPVYIAANISSRNSNFVVGDMRMYGIYQNYELESNSSYQVAVAVFISDQQVRHVKYFCNSLQ